MKLINFFKSPWRVVKLKLEIEHKNRQIGGHKASFTKIRNAWSECSLINGCVNYKIPEAVDSIGE